jgi:virginiamycin B lyase
MIRNRSTHTSIHWLQMATTFAAVLVLCIVLPTIASGASSKDNSHRLTAQSRRSLRAARQHRGLPPGTPVPGWAKLKGQHPYFMPVPAAGHSQSSHHFQGASTTGLGKESGGPGDESGAEEGGIEPSGHGIKTEGSGKNALGLRCESGYCPPPPLRWYGGFVQLAPEVHLIFWGSNWNKEPGTAARTAVTKMFEGLRNSEYQEILSQYFDSTGHILSWAVEIDSYTDTGVAAPSNVNHESIENEMLAAIAAHSPNWGWSDNEQYIVMPAPGTSYESEFAEEFCAYHSYDEKNHVYSFVPYMGDEPFSGRCRSGGQIGIVETMTKSASHEYAESATDPIWYDSPGWMDFEGYEISDICSTAPDELPNGSFVSGQYDNHQNKCSIADYNPPNVMALTDTASNVGEHAATINATIYPEQSATTYKFEWGTTTSYGNTVPLSGETSAGSSPGGVGVSTELTGLTRDQVYHYRVRAKNGWGTTYGEDRTFVPSVWSIHPQAEPERDGTSWLNDISCVSSGQCTTVGWAYNSKISPEPNALYSYSGSGSSWQAHAMAMPEAWVYPEDEGVSCSSANACTATGQAKAGGIWIPIAERWNGSSWSVQSVPSPGGGPSNLRDVSCASSSDCIAVGYTKTAEGIWISYSAHWNGSSWSNLSTPSGNEAVDSELRDVSCATTSFCVAVGWYYPASGGGEKPLIETWNGSSWSLQTPARTNGRIYGVSCSSTQFCMAVEGPSIETWNGAKWSTENVVTPPETSSFYLEGVSCVSAAYCMVSGGAYPKAGGRAYTLVETRSEGSWRVSPTPHESEYARNELWGVSCTETTGCAAVGGSKAGGGFNILLETKLDLRPTIKAETSASYPGPGKATLKGGLNPHGFASHYHVEWGTEAEFKKGEYNHRAPLSVDASSGAAETDTAVEQTIEGLKGKSLYHYRFVAESPEGKAIGADHSLTTPEWPPVLSAVEASEISTAGAHVSGTVNPKGFEAKYRFEYVNAAHYEVSGYTSAKKAPISDGTVASSSEPVAVSQTLKELEPHTTYHVRLEASSDGGTAYGEDKTFTTLRAISAPTYSSSFGSRGTGNGQFTNPWGIAVDPSGNVWISDSIANRVQKFNSKGEYQCQIGTKGTGDGQFINPHGIAADASGNVWVADAGNRRMQKIGPACEYLSKFGSSGTGDGQFSPMGGAAIDPSGNIWVADGELFRIQKFNSKGEYLAKCGSSGTGDGQFEEEPLSIAADVDGNVWVGFEATRIQKFNSKCEYITKFDKTSSGAPSSFVPRSVAIDPAGNLWVPSYTSHNVSGFFPEGEYMAKFGQLGTGAGQFTTPQGIAAAADGTLWVIDHSGSADRIEKWVPGAAYPVETGQASQLKATEATLKGKVNPQSVATSYQFEYGATAAMNNAIPATPKSIGSGSSPVAVSETLNGLDAGVTYYYHLVATSEKGTTYGETRHFTTLKPENTALPVISPATPFQNVPETTTKGTWLGATSYSYQWQRCNGEGKSCSNISGATSSTYMPVEADIGQTLLVKVTGSAESGASSTVSSAVTGKVVAAGTAAAYTLTKGSHPYGIVAGPDSNLWFTNAATAKIGKITTSGTITSYSLPAGSSPANMAAGPDGKLWFAESGTSKIGKITTSGTITEYALPAESKPNGITAGPDGNLWFTNSKTSKVGKITTSGTITEYALPAGSGPTRITAGPDGNLWLVEGTTAKIAKITTSGTITEYPVPSKVTPVGITAGPDGNLWFTVFGLNKIGKITTSGTITEYALPATSFPEGIAAGPDGNLWFVDWGAHAKIGRITTSGTITEFAAPAELSHMRGIVAGPDNRMWFTAEEGGIPEEGGVDRIGAIVP